MQRRSVTHPDAPSNVPSDAPSNVPSEAPSDAGPAVRPDRFVNGEVSFWYRALGLPERRPALPGDLDVDVALVGGGLTGLWTAYYLKKAQPDLRIAVLEKEFAGYGASGRNGGWLSAEPPGQMRRYAAAHDRAAAVALQKEMFASVDEAIRVAAEEGIDADIVKGGVLRIATNAAQEHRLQDRLPALRYYGWGRDDLLRLDADGLAERVRVRGARAAHFSPHCARIQPAKLVRGLAVAVERLGVAIYEDTEVLEVGPRAAGPNGGRGGGATAVTPHGTVRADHIIRATEGFSATLPDSRRAWLPMNSSMIVTEPLPEHIWAEIGWQGAELIGDEAHSYCYVQRTADGRIAIGGRGIPYRYGSQIDAGGETRPATQHQLRAILARHFPATRDLAIDHTWSGVLGVPRDWCATVHLDRDTGLGWAGGYVGHGVTTTNLAGRTLRDLILRQDTELTRLPWVGRRVRGWEPEPLRWLGVRALYAAYRAADRQENAGLPGTSFLARAADAISGR